MLYYFLKQFWDELCLAISALFVYNEVVLRNRHILSVKHLKIQD